MTEPKFDHLERMLDLGTHAGLPALQAFHLLAFPCLANGPDLRALGGDEEHRLVARRFDTFVGSGIAAVAEYAFVLAMQQR